jgi:hypothetical protein
MFAEILGDVGKPAEGLITIQDALDASRKTGLIYHEAEIYRLKGELLLQKISSAERNGKDNRRFSDAEGCFNKSIRIVRLQHARSFELRATTSLARLWQQLGRQTEARKRLKEIYEWSGEGYETADLQDARKLLNELS